MNRDPPRYDVDFNLDSGLVGVGVGVDGQLKKWRKSVPWKWARERKEVSAVGIKRCLE